MKIAVCDDDVQIRRQIAELIRCHIPLGSVWEYGSGEDLLREPQAFEIIVLDIKMQGISGIEAAKSLRSSQSKAEIIFATGLEEYVFHAFDVGAFHYLMKPLDKGKFLKVLDEAVIKSRENRKLEELLKEHGTTARSIVVKTKTVVKKVWINDIYAAEVNNRKVTLYTKTEDIEFYAKLSQLHRELGDTFFRCHRAYLVHLEYVSGYHSEAIFLENGMQVFLTKQKYAEFVTAYMQYMKRMSQKDEQ